MKKILSLFILFLLLFVVGYTQNNYSLDTIETTEEDIKKPLIKYLKEVSKADNNDNMDIFLYMDVPNEEVDKYMKYLFTLNLRESQTQGIDGQQFHYKGIVTATNTKKVDINKRRVEINIVCSAVTGNIITIYVESPIIN